MLMPPSAAKSTKSRVDDFMSFLDNVEQEFSQVVPSHRTAQKSIEDSFSIGDPKEAYSKVRERLLELEIEKEEQQKQLEMVKALRQKDKEQSQISLSEVEQESRKQ